LKRGFPGDPEFSLQNYWKLPYIYVIKSIENLNKIQRYELHSAEKPIAYLAFQNAELNRDKKKRRQPFKPEEFYYYADLEAMDLPEPRFGAAAMELIRLEMFPNWALFAYPELKKRAMNAIAPELLCYQCQDAIILAPNIEGAMVQGMLIAGKTASNERREMISPCSRTITVLMPTILGEFEAIEESEIRIVG
jgi:hypothetical protein